MRPPQPRRLRTFRAPSRYARYSRCTQKQPVRYMRYMRYVRYTAYVCMFGRRGKGAEISLMGVRFFEIAIPLVDSGRKAKSRKVQRVVAQRYEYS